MILCTSASAQTQFINHRKSIEERIAEFEKKKEAVLTPSSDHRMMKAAIQTVQAIESQATKSPVRRALQTRAEEGKDIVLLDSVISDTRCVYYEYNEFGWLVAERVYECNDGYMVLDTEESFFFEYDFDAQGRCTRYARFLYDTDGAKGEETERRVITWGSDKERTEQYYAVSSDDDKWKGLALLEEEAYDKYGNFCLGKYYDWDAVNDTMYLGMYGELKYSGNVTEYSYDEDGNVKDVYLNDALFELYCYYYVLYHTIYNGENRDARLEGFKIDRKVDGLTTTKTRYEIDPDYSYSNEIDLTLLDTYWEFTEEAVITLTPSRNRYASVYYYDVERVGVEYQTVTRASGDKVLDASYVFEWDEYERLVKKVYTDDEGDVETYTCSYIDDEYYVITLADFEEALLLHWEGMEKDDKCVMEGNFYGIVHKERSESGYGYGERVNDEYDANGNVTHCTYCEVYYSDVEAGKDLNGDGIMSEEREIYNSEAWLTYNANGNLSSYIEYNDGRETERAYSKYVYVNEKEDGLYLNGYSEYVGSSKEGPWTLSWEEIYIFEVDPSTDYNASPIGIWWRSYDPESKIWSGYKRMMKDGNYVEYPIDPQTGEFSTTTYAPATRSDDELQYGYHQECFIEGNWEYTIEKSVDYVWDDASQDYVLKLVGGYMVIVWRGENNGAIGFDTPEDNYVFPLGIYASMWEDESINNDISMQIDWLTLDLDVETGEWRIIEGREAVRKANHYTNEQGQIVNNYTTYVFDQASERMIALPDVNQIIYSFDALNRLSSIDYMTHTVHYIYLNDDCNYLAESYSIDKASGAKYDVCKYYYSNGRYIPPYTDIEEAEVANTWVVSGTSVVADGMITLYNMNGQVVAAGNGVVVAPQSGLYIVEVGGTRAKIRIK